MRKVLFIAGISLLLACVYSFKGFFPKDLKKVWIPVFENKTLRYGLEDFITLAFQEEVIRDGRLEVTDSSHAAMKVVGKIVSYKKEPFSYDESGKVIEYKVTVQAEIGFFRLRKGDYYLEPTTFRGWGTYNADSEEEEDGIKKAVKDLSENVLRALFLRSF